jgi:hypothetical protein
MKLKSLKSAAAIVFMLVAVCVRPSICRAASFEFVNRDIGEILYAVSMFRGFPVTADDTVHGTADFRFAGGDFESAFDSFARQSRLYVEKKEKSWTVSRVRFSRKALLSESAPFSEKNNGGKTAGAGDFQKDTLISVDACDVLPALLFEHAGIETGICITYDSLPVEPVSVHTGFCSKQELIKRIAGQCPGCEVSQNMRDDSGDFIHIARTAVNTGIVQQPGMRAEFIKGSDGLWSCDAANIPLQTAVEKLCTAADTQFCITGGGDGKIARALLSGKTFRQMLEMICLEGGAETFYEDGVNFIIPSSQAHAKITNAGKSWREYRLLFANADSFISVAKRRFPDIETIPIAGSSIILYCSSDADCSRFVSFAEKIDMPPRSHLVKLQYLRVQDFFAHLPPFVDKSSVFDSGSGDSFYFTGTDEAYGRLVSELPSCDKPVTRISYDLLIMQYQNSDGSEWTPSLRVDRLVPGDINGITAVLGSVLDLNLNVVSAFGLSFAAELQTAISSSKAHVFADTTLNGVNGSTISFQNTNTYRYRDNNLDPDTGKPVYSGITKEISSGLKLEVTGIVSGDGMITSKITASVSRQGADISSKTGNPPPTSEKVITTEVRARSGEPVVLSGLVQNETDETVSRTPLLSRIPLIGYVFKSEKKSAERTELVIYLVPSAELDGAVKKKMLPSSVQKENEQSEMVRLYREFVHD